MVKLMILRATMCASASSPNVCVCVTVKKCKRCIRGSIRLCAERERERGGGGEERGREGERARESEGAKQRESGVCERGSRREKG